jgi:RHS repeat-associated protein
MHHNGLGRNDQYLLNNQGQFVAPPEFFTTLAHNSDGSYTLRYKDGTAKHFASNGSLQQISDRIGNTLSFAYNAQGQLITVTDTLARPITYSYNAAGQLTGITDFIGRTVTYTYDSSGDLASVTSPAVTGTPNHNDFPSGKTTVYTYDSNHRILTITRPNEVASSGPAVLQNTYDSSGRVTAQVYGGTNASGVPAGGTFSFTYTQLNPGVTSDDPNLPVMRTQEVDRDGNVTQYDYNRLGYPVVIREFTRGLRSTDPSVYVTTMTYNADGRLLEKAMPQGNTVQYTYDEGDPNRLEQGNMLQQTRTPDAARGGDQQFLTTTYTYEPVFNHVLTMTDARGNDPSFSPPNGGSNSPARYTTTYTYDSNGNVLEKQQPTVTLPNGTSQQIVTNYTYNQFGQITTETDAEGNVTEYTYYPMNDPSNLAGGYLKEKIVDATTSSRRSETAPPAKITTQYFYDQVGNVTRTIDGRGNDILYTYNQLNQVVEIQSEAPFRYTTYTFYDANDNVIQKNIENKIAVASGGKPIFTSDGNFSAEDGTPAFFINRYTYDILDKLVTQDLDATGSNPSRVVTQYRYDPNENRVREIRPAGNITAYQYDERDLLFTKTRGLGTSSASSITDNYDLNRNLAETIDGRGFETNYQYDGFDRKIEIIDAAGNQTISHYDPVGNVISTSTYGHPGGPSPADNSGAGNVLLKQRAFEYDELSRNYQFDERPVNGSSFVASGVATVRPPSIATGPLNPGSISTQLIYDRNGRTVQQIEDDLATTAVQYDGVNRRVLLTDPQGNSAAYTYDANSNVVQTVETELSQKSGVASETFTTTYQYDTHNRQIQISDNCQNTRRSAYDSRDNLTDATDAKADNTVGCPGTVNAQGNSMRYSYDGLNRRIQSTQDLRVGGIGSGSIDTSNPSNPTGEITETFSYDGNSRLIGLVDNNGNATGYTYDSLDRRTVETLPDNTTTKYSYDPDDNILTLTDNNGTIQNHTYDRVNRRIQTEVTLAPGVIGTTLNTYQYDGLNRRTQMTDNNDPSDATSASTVNSAYDSLGRVVEETQNGRAVDEGWFAQAQRKSLTYPNGRELNYTYDSLERIQTIKDAGAGSNIVQYTYIGPQRILQRQYQNGSQLTYLDNTGTTDIGYDRDRREIERRDLVTENNSLIVGFTYSYDRENNKSNEAKLHSATNSELYSYDSAYRLTDFQRGAAPPSRTQGWTLDAVGNWRVNTVNGLAQNRTVNSTNEYTAINTTALPYDQNGNLLSSSGLGYQWDYKNRLRRVCSLPANAMSCTAPGALVIATYGYDAMNRRIRKAVTNFGSLNGTTNFYYDGWRTIEERDGSDALTQQYTYGIYIDEPLTLDTAHGKRFFYHQNSLSSTFALTDASGKVVEGYQYDPYGQRTVFAPNFTTITGTMSAYGNPYMFTGQRTDTESGLYFYRERYYDPVLGRFLQRDPAQYADGMNLYSYVAGNPTHWTDPTGLFCGECVPSSKGGVANEKNDRVVKLERTSVAKEPGQWEANLSVLDDISTLGALSGLANMPANALKGLALAGTAAGATNGALSSLVKKYATKGMPSGSDFKGPLEKIKNLLEGEYGNGYWLWLVVDYESCDPCCEWRGYVKGYKWVTHSKNILITEGGGSSGTLEGIFGGMDKIQPPSAEDMANAIKRATTPGSKTVLPPSGW